RIQAQTLHLRGKGWQRPAEQELALFQRGWVLPLRQESRFLLLGELIPLPTTGTALSIALASPLRLPRVDYGLNIAASGALTAMYRQDVYANNLANMETVGYKPDIPVVKQRLDARHEDHLNLP